ncbi:MAG TPA: helicase-related protein [Bacilli bacterium]|nr:helicase-related protein [Bacilli bacterium]
MDALFVCPRCGNNDPNSIGVLNHQQYCRACIAFSGTEVDGDIKMESIDNTLEVGYDFSEEQTRLGAELIDCFDNNQHVLVHAVTGAGKTEIVYPVIAHALAKKLRVGFAIPRRDVVIELALRFQAAFPHLEVVAVYGGHTDKITGDITMLTTHQIYRYQAYFDLLIVDEYDAFPFKDNRVLEAFLTRSLKGVLIALTATPTSDMITRFSSDNHTIKQLWVRYHRQPIPVPSIVIRHWLFKLDYLFDAVNRYHREGKRLIIFVPTIEVGARLYKTMRIFAPDGAFVHSKHEMRNQIINDFRMGSYRYLISTSVLERGITLLNLQVIIYDAHHDIFDSAMLLQMAGRVGRKKEAPHGDVIFLSIRKTIAMQEAIKAVEHANRHL